MIGNDLVDLNLAKTQSNWQRKGYLDKIFTLFEQNVIYKSSNPNEMVWTFWSMKEAAYKIHNRKTGTRNFAPTKLACYLDFPVNKNRGFVTVDDQQYFTQTFVETDYVHTIAASFYNKLKEIDITIFKYPDNLFNYKSTGPGCVSHHGDFLALVY
jgi:phosphopantetheinyl transferase (holo-ACP synthase)